LPNKLGFCLVRLYRHLLRSSPQVRGRFLGVDEPLYLARWWRALVTLAILLALLPLFLSVSMVGMRESGSSVKDSPEWLRSSRASSSWSISSQSMWARIFITPVSSGIFSTSIGRPFSRSGSEGFAGTATSGLVPVVVPGCSARLALLHGGEEIGSVCNCNLSARSYLQMPRTHVLFFFPYRVLCNITVHSLFYN
jgi:hypothetical protein